MSELLNLAEYKQQLTEQISNLDLSDYELPNDFKRQFHNFGEYKIEEYYKYTIKVSSKKSVCYIPNQWVFIAAICSKYCIELKKYKQKLQSLGITDEDFESCHPSSSDKLIPDEHRTNEYVSKKAADLLNSYDGDDKDFLISFLWDYDSWGGGKNIKRDNDFTISPCLNVANSINASSSLIGDLAKAIGDDNNLYDSLINSAEMDKIRKGVQIVKNELVRERLAASFLKMAMKTTLDLDKNLSGLEKTGKYKVTRKNLKIDGFWIGRDKNQPPTRDSDIYPDVSWSFNNKEYVLNVEITPKDMEEIFFPAYNDAYQRQLFMEKDLNGDYVLYKIIKPQQQIDLISLYPLQQIFYGAPGTGKSHEIKEKTKGDDSVIRTTFHPDSDYSTFVGCYKPTMGDPKPIYGFDATGKTVKVEDPKGTIINERKIEYEFVPQAFTKAYVQAWKKMCNINHIKSIPIGASVVGNAKSPYEKTDFIGTNSSFNYKEKGAKLTDDEKEALVKVDNFDFPFDGIHSFGELHDELTVIVTDKPTEEQSDRYYKEITLSAKQIRELYRLFIENRDTFGFLESILSKILQELNWSWHPDLDKLKDYNGNDITIEVREGHQLLGLYDSATKTVYLFKNNIRGDIGLLRAVYIHEMFHAYFHSQELYIPEIEEPIVECCALCFLELFDNKICETYKVSVKRKQQSSAICYYGFGVVLFEHRSLDWMKLYQNGLNNVDASSSIVKEYTNKYSPVYPFDDEQKTMDLLYNILNPQSNTKQDKSAQFLIIEEINRGNCAQIFGDLFQLLDRNEYGYSEYPIVADDDLKKVLAEEFKNLNLDALKQEIDAVFKENYPNGITDKILNGKLLVLPKNFYIWATMNTSDQSLFPIDSAFKRRWEWKYMPIGYKNKDWTIKIGEKEYKWVDFQRTINDKIYSVDNSEDKQLGDFFVDANRTSTIITADTLLNKILFYIWNDVCKDDPDQIFRWKDYKDDKEKSIRFSDFFDNDRDKKLQGLMCFLEVNAIGESEETNETEPSLTTEESETSESLAEKDDEVTP